MPKRRVESDVERTHGHCADVFLEDFGIPKEMRKEVCEEVAKVWQQVTMIHCMIIMSVRGFQPHPATRSLEIFLKRHATRPQKNSKEAVREREREPGGFERRKKYDFD